MESFKPHLLKGISTGNEGKSRSETPLGPNIHKLSSNENLLGTSPRALEAIRMSINSINEYPDKTSYRLKVALSKAYDSRLKPRNFFCCNGGIGVLELIISAFMDQDSECIYSGPTFEPFEMFPNKMGAKSTNIPLKKGSFKLDVEAIHNAINHKTKIIWLCSPNNPTGSYVSKNEVERLLLNLPRHVLIVFDEVYHHFAHAKDYVSALPYVERGENIIAVNSFSKIYGLAGMRIGYGYGPQHIVDYIDNTIRPFLVNSIAMEAAIAALGDKGFLGKTQKMVLEGKKYLYREFDKIGIEYWNSQTNFVLIKVPMTNKKFEKDMLNQGIMVRSVFGFESDRYVRITIGTPEINKTMIAAMKKVLNSTCLNCGKCKCHEGK